MTKKTRAVIDKFIDEVSESGESFVYKYLAVRGVLIAVATVKSDSVIMASINRQRETYLSSQKTEAK